MENADRKNLVHQIQTWDQGLKKESVSVEPQAVREVDMYLGTRKGRSMSTILRDPK